MNSNKNTLFRPEYAISLLRIAEGDLATAWALIQSASPGRIENVLYMIQQSVEKTLKAVLVKKQIAFPLVHDLGILIALLPESSYPPGGFEWTALNPYASIRRYEEGSLPITREEVLASYNAAILVIDWAKNIINTNH
jgi:HEPN domain-containing protein